MLHKRWSVPETSFGFHFLDATFDATDTHKHHYENNRVELQQQQKS